MAAWEQDLVELVEARGLALARYAYLLCGDQVESADLVQEGIVRALSRLTKVRDSDRLESYVRRAILNTYLDGRRRHRRWQTKEHLLVQQAELESADDLVTSRQLIHTAMSTLSPRQRACVVLRYYEDLSVPDIAEALDCREGTVKRHLSDAIRRLGENLQIEAKEFGYEL